jgi:hypothetical protein
MRHERKFVAKVLIYKTVYWGRSGMFNIPFASSANVDRPDRNLVTLVCYNECYYYYYYYYHYYYYSCKYGY